jgi:hypothetical protein
VGSYKIGGKAMERIKEKESPIVRLTRWQVETSLPRKSINTSPKSENWTIYGVDSEGIEKIYAQVPNEQFQTWAKTDRLWGRAQSAMFARLLSDPRTRDLVIKINIKEALEKDDNNSAIMLWNALSDSAKSELAHPPSQT